MIRSGVIICLVLAEIALAQTTISLPPPQKQGGLPLMECLAKRHSSREFANTALPPQELSNLLWAAFGVNREDGRRTAPSAMNRQEIEIYAATEAGVYRYDAPNQALLPFLSGDHRAETGKQDFVGTAALNLVYVADDGKMGESTEADRILYPAADAGCIVQNVYLYCASAGLATVVRGWVDRDSLAVQWKLGPNRRIILAQTVGFPAP